MSGEYPSNPNNSVGEGNYSDTGDNKSDYDPTQGAEIDLIEGEMMPPTLKETGDRIESAKTIEETGMQDAEEVEASISQIEKYQPEWAKTLREHLEEISEIEPTEEELPQTEAPTLEPNPTPKEAPTPKINPVSDEAEKNAEEKVEVAGVLPDGTKIYGTPEDFNQAMQDYFENIKDIVS